MRAAGQEDDPGQPVVKAVRVGETFLENEIKLALADLIHFQGLVLIIIKDCFHIYVRGKPEITSVWEVF